MLSLRGLEGRARDAGACLKNDLVCKGTVEDARNSRVGRRLEVVGLAGLGVSRGVGAGWDGMLASGRRGPRPQQR